VIPLIRWIRVRWVRIILLLGYVAAIYFVSSRPNLSTPVEFLHADKAAHFAEYSLLGWLLAGVLDPEARWRTRTLLLAVLGFVLVLGLFDEWHQSWVPGRDSSLLDLMADLAGAAAGLFLWRKIR
jgi:VanZ family protein